MSNKLILRKAKVLFFDPIDKGFGTSITIEVTKENYDEIAAFWDENKIGNEKTEIGVPNIKQHESQHQLSLKVNSMTKYAGLNGLGKEDIGFGAVVDIFLNAFEYNNKFTKGKTFTGASVSAVLVVSAGGGSTDSALSELIEMNT